MKYSIYLMLFILLGFSKVLLSQNSNTRIELFAPLDTPLVLSGSFGELRNNHFHSGLDIKTGGVTGKRVYSINDGYVSRINISSTGYGKALYVTHPDGRISVYCHLDGLSPRIDKYLQREQYQAESFELDLYLPPDSLPVRKGEHIAFSGNSGSSAGPHLHFEIRDTSYNRTFNPMFDYIVPDKVPPYINLLKIYPADKMALINGKTGSQTYSVTGKGRYHKLNTKYTPVISGNVYFGIQSYDPFNNGANINGIYSVKLIIDSTTIFSYDFDSLRFDQTRYINSLIDYKEQPNHKIQRSYLDPNNQLDIYEVAINRGIFLFNEDRNYHVSYQVCDFSGNMAGLSFIVKGKKPAGGNVVAVKPKPGAFSMSYTRNNVFKEKDIVFEVPGSALYDDLEFLYKILPRSNGFVSDFHLLHDESVPLHTYCRLSIKPENIKPALLEKCAIVQVKGDGIVKYAGGETGEDGSITARIRLFGKYAIKIDTIPPVINPLNIYNNKSIRALKQIRLKIGDNLSGIKTYKGKLNGKWILMEFDAKSAILVYNIDSHVVPGRNQFELIVTDNKNNNSRYSAVLIY